MPTPTTRELDWLRDEKYAGETPPAYFSDVERLKAGEPLAYVIGFVPFLGCHIDLSLRPFIPRPETELWVEKAIGIIKKEHPSPQPLRILDMFSGSGAIGVAVAKHLASARVDFGEQDEKLIQQIEKNISLNAIDASRTKALATNSVEVFSGPYDYVFGNPPYISEHKRDSVQKSVRDFEPDRALFSKDGGLAVAKPFLQALPRLLAPTGTAFMEFGEGQKEKLETFLYDLPLACEFWRDQYGFWRTLVLTKIPPQKTA